MAQGLQDEERIARRAMTNRLDETVRNILIECLQRTPRYVRLTRVIRDIPTTNVVEGFKKAKKWQSAWEILENLDFHTPKTRTKEREDYLKKERDELKEDLGKTKRNLAELMKAYQKRKDGYGKEVMELKQK